MTKARDIAGGFKTVNGTSVLGSGDISTGASTLLGTLTPTSGATSLTLSSVDLSEYKFLEVHVNHVNFSSVNAYVGLNSDAEGHAMGKQTSGATTSGYGMSVRALVNLDTGVMYAGVSGTASTNSTPVAWVGINDTYAGGHTNIGVTTATTSLTIYMRSGYSFSLAQGNIKFYGVK